MTTFDGRERGYENKFAHDQETEFKISARLNHLLGLWAAEKLQLMAEEAEKYAQSLVDLTVKKETEVCVKQQLQKDFSAKGLEVELKDIELEMEKLHQTARDQVINVG
jgi:hypothetical protein